MLENASRLERWIDALRPVRKVLLEPLGVIFRDPGRTESERVIATDILEQYAAADPRFLVKLIEAASIRQFATLLPVLKPHRAEVVELLEEELDKLPAHGASEQDEDKLASQQANSAVALLLLDEPRSVWPLFRHSPDPRLRGYVLDRLQPLGVDAALLFERLHQEKEISARRALILALADYRRGGLPAAEATSLERELLDAFRVDPDPGIHSASSYYCGSGGRPTGLTARRRIEGREPRCRPKMVYQS